MIRSLERLTVAACLLLIAGPSVDAAGTRARGGPVAWMSQAPANWLLVVSGVGGDDEHRQRFVEQSLRLIAAAQERFGVPDEQIVYLPEREELAPERASGRSTREQIEAAFARIGAAAAADDQVLVVLIGHGSAQGDAGRFALPGPDMAPVDFAPLLDLLSAQRVAFVNTASASGGFLGLAAPGRVVITATRSPRERERTVFGGYFVEAFAGRDADTDKDGRITLLEAFRYAVMEVERSFARDGRLVTEHALLDDNGDGEGTATPALDSTDGALAAALGLGLPLAVSAEAAANDAELADLIERRAELQVALDALRTRRDTLDEDAYLDALEALLVQIAETDAAIRARDGASR